jgi:thiamine pyrophosphate-dependent acetolactate synthase large subunit-like protein
VWSSDAFAETLRRLGLPYVALTPGSSFRGLHDSLVNHLGNDRPELIVCLHEEHAVAVAHGYAKVTERPLAAALHANVGLMHATMALFNAYCDRVPLLAVGATGPVDEALRRPWIDWLHTTPDQAAIVRPFLKWDAQPDSAQAGVNALVEGWTRACSYPCGPAYVCLDSALQESPLPPGVTPHLTQPPAPPAPRADEVDRAAGMLATAERPLVLAGRVGRGQAEWDARVRLMESLGARVLTDLKAAAAFPIAHALHPAPAGTFLTPEGATLVREADAILSLDWIDLAGTLKAAGAGARVISCTIDDSGLFAPPDADLEMAAHPDRLVAALVERVPRREAVAPARRDATGDGLAAALRRALAGATTCTVRLPLSWDGADLDIAHPLDYLGQDGGAGIGSGPGMAVGAALALKGSGRLPVAVLGDGDLLMGASALWTAARYRLGLLVVVANNRSYGNDELHQERVARHRSRPVENRWIGQHLRDPDPDLAALARSLGLKGHGPVSDHDELEGVLATAAEEAATGASVLVDVRVAGPGPAA